MKPLPATLLTSSKNRMNVKTAMKHDLGTPALLIGACMLLTGCGGGSEAPKLPENVYQGIFVTTNDCAENENLTFDICAKAVDKAIKLHNQSSPTYPSLRACAATEGADKCERDINQKFRPRLMAYLVQSTKPPTGIPLYATPNGERGFRDTNKTLYLESDLKLQFSKKATAVMELHARPGKPRGLF